MRWGRKVNETGMEGRKWIRKGNGIRVRVEEGGKWKGSAEWNRRRDEKRDGGKGVA
jgi:hypothetical protein